MSGVWKSRKQQQLQQAAQLEKQEKAAAQREEEEEYGEPVIPLEHGFGSYVIIDNLPVVAADRYEKLLAVLKKICSTIGNVVVLHMPQDQANNSKGYAFVEYENAELAQVAVEKIDNYRLDKSHVLKVVPFDCFEEVMKTSDQYHEPTIPPYEPKENLRWWTGENRVAEQFVLKYDNVTEVFWNDLKETQPNDALVRRTEWTRGYDTKTPEDRQRQQKYVMWSPHGSYIATIHPEGVALWGGPKWEKMARFPHHGVSLIDFSPNEKYLITLSKQFEKEDNTNDSNYLVIWDIRNAEKLRGFPAQSFTSTSWPLFKWSFDDSYFAKLSENSISVYKTPSMDLLDKASIKIPGVKHFEWSPSDNLLAYFVPSTDEKPASLVLLDIPSKKEKRTKNLMTIQDCKMYWQSKGDYLAIAGDKPTKNKKNTYTDFELFRIREKDIPSDHYEMKDAVHGFEWEPQGSKFGVIHGELPRPNVTFYTMDPKFKELKTLEKRACSHLFWSPQGTFVVLGGLGKLNGSYEFINTADMESLAVEEHFMGEPVNLKSRPTSVKTKGWDPSGRYFVTEVSYWNYQVENGYNIYSFQGKLLKKVLKDKFFEFLWRPRPPTLLSQEKVNYIKNNIGEYAKEMKAEDKAVADEERQKKRQKRKQMRVEFEALLARKRKEYEEEATIRREMGIIDGEREEDIEYRTEVIETVESIQEIVL